MSEITYVRGDATVPFGKGTKMIAHVLNDVGGWGKGFVPVLSRRRPEPEAPFRAWNRDRGRNAFSPDAVRLVRGDPHVRVADMVGRRGVRTGGKGVPVRYEAVGTALGRLADHMIEHGASVPMSRIGCGLTGGTWTRVEPLVTDRLVRRGIAVSVDDHGEGGE